MDTHFSKEDKDKILALRRELQKHDALKPNLLPQAQTVRNTGDLAPPTVTPKKRIQVEPDFLSILNQRTPTTPESTPKTSIATNANRRRSELANWIADPNNPLSTRVIVNSATYRQSSRHPDSARLMKMDPRNQWYWRGDVRRLDAEQIRDAVLAVSGSLNRSASGPAASDDKHRRSIYTIVTRNSRNPLLDAFDLPLFFTSTASRDTTTNPLQSLMLINSQAMLDHAKQLAERADQEPVSVAIRKLWQLSYGRLPDATELRSAEGFIATQMNRYLHESSPAKTEIETSTLPYRDGAAVVIKPDDHAKPRSMPNDSLETDEFAVEAIFQLGSIYESGSVRSIVSTWSGKKGSAGWTFGVTGKGSRRKPQTLVLHAFGSDGKSKVVEAAVFSDQHVDVGKPYYAAASIRSARPRCPVAEQ